MKHGAYYNEFDKHAAAWLRELIRAGHIAPGDVDERSITEVRGADLAGYTQVHFFAGIGGWSYALRLAGWPDARPVWTGSCPCQPFSCAGRGRGEKDPRHLWPEFRRLIAECRPPTVFGEQVASRAGREWLAGVFADLEGMAYRRAGADLCAAGAGAPHVRQRLFWVGHSECNGLVQAIHPSRFRHLQAQKLGAGLELPNTSLHSSPGGWNRFKTICDRYHKVRRIESGTFPLAHGVPARVVRLRGYGNAIVPQVAATFIRACLPELT